MISSRLRVRAALAGVLTVAMTGLALGTAAPAAVGAGEVSMVPMGTVGQSGHAGLYGWGAATMCNGDVLIGDYWNMRVLRFGEDGSPKGVFIDDAGFGATQHQAPYGLAVDPGTCDVFMADTDRRQVDRYRDVAGKGQYVRSYGQSGVVGETATTFRYPSRVAVENGLLVVADTWANRISVWRVDGAQELFRLQGVGSGNGQFRQPRGMSFDAQGRLHVADQGNKRVQVFRVDADRLTFLYKYGRPFVSGGTGDQVVRGDLRGLAIDKAAGFSYLVDGEGNRVHKFAIGDSSATFVRSFGQDRFTDGGREATVDRQGRIWVGNMPGFSAEVFSREGNWVASYPHPVQLPPPGGFNGPRGVAVDPRPGLPRNLYVSDTYNFRIQKLAPNGTWLDEWGTRGRGDYEFNYTRLLAVDPRNGDVVVADTDNHRIKKYDANGTFVWGVGGAGSTGAHFKNPHGVDVGPDGKVYVADSNGARVEVLSPTGEWITDIGSAGTGPTQFRRPRGVVADDVNGDVYVADSIRNIVQVYRSDGSHKGTFGNPGTMPVPMGGPFDLEVDDEFLYVADTPRNKIVVFDKTSRAFVAEFGGPGTALGKLNQPQGLDLVDGVLYIAEQKNERISKWRVVRGTVVQDTTKPTSSVTGPTTNQTFAAPPVLIEGTATDDVGVGRVEVRIQHRTTKQWWNPDTGAWQGAAKWIGAAVDAAGQPATAWSYSFDPGGSGPFVVTRRAVDTSGNAETVVSGSGVRFTIS